MEEQKEQDVSTYISIKDILSRLKVSTYFQALNETTKRKISFHYLSSLFEHNELFNDDYVKSLNRTINKVRIHKYNLLNNWELIVDNDSETNEYNDAINNINNDSNNSTNNSTNNT